ncbi:uncharacterized protein LOC135811480 isoform X2 [Sycon ciliatum]|uniref:uncharacterized protein LOC135811480 isoform X2 n=1 Tax=Sycon ciliatum TaxID=27933 RepID=UPI0031F60085
MCSEMYWPLQSKVVHSFNAIGILRSIFQVLRTLLSTRIEKVALIRLCGLLVIWLTGIAEDNITDAGNERCLFDPRESNIMEHFSRAENPHSLGYDPMSPAQQEIAPEIELAAQSGIHAQLQSIKSRKGTVRSTRQAEDIANSLPEEHAISPCHGQGVVEADGAKYTAESDTTRTRQRIPWQRRISPSGGANAPSRTCGLTLHSCSAISAVRDAPGTSSTRGTHSTASLQQKRSPRYGGQLGGEAALMASRSSHEEPAPSSTQCPTTPNHQELSSQLSSLPTRWDGSQLDPCTKRLVYADRENPDSIRASDMKESSLNDQPILPSSYRDMKREKMFYVVQPSSNTIPSYIARSKATFHSLKPTHTPYHMLQGSGKPKIWRLSPTTQGTNTSLLVLPECTPSPTSEAARPIHKTPSSMLMRLPERPMQATEHSAPGSLPKRKWSRYETKEESPMPEIEYVSGAPIPEQWFTLPKFLPPKRCSKPYTLILDLDNTLVYCSPSLLPGRPYGVSIRLGPEKKQVVYFRPFCIAFLRRMSRHYELVVYTAATRGYADQIVTHFNSEGGVNILHILDRNHCVNGTVKCLARVGRDMQRTVFIDDMPKQVAYNWQNAIAVSPWTGDSEDTELVSLAEVLLTLVMDSPNDVRPQLRIGSPLFDINDRKLRFYRWKSNQPDCEDGGG